MEDATMMEGSQGLFEEQCFIIIPHGLPDGQLDKVCDVSRIVRDATDESYSCEKRSPASAVP
jgi:hypothetical protein